MPIRRLQLQDAIALQALRSQSNSTGTLGTPHECTHALKIESVQRQLQEPYETYGEYKNEKLCGAATLSPMPEDPLDPENPDWYAISGVMVSPGHRGRGIGRRLIETCFIRATELCANGLLLEVNEPNPSAMALYKSFGFKIRHKAEGVYTFQGVQFDQVSMYKALPRGA